jgi:PAS domain S-box-containing protein
MGQILGTLMVAKDITERKRLETAERDQFFLAAIVSTAEDVIVSKDLNGVVTSWNRAAEKLFGYTAEEMIGRPISILIPPEHFNEEPRILERIRRGERIENYETIRVRKDGRLIHIGLTVSPMMDSLGRIIGASKIARDITSQKQAEMKWAEALRQEQVLKTQAEEARRHAEEANRAKDEFLATISHELRTPMSAIIGWSRMLMSGVLTPERQELAVKTIDRNARAQAQLIEDLLDISRIISGKLRIEFKPVDLEGVITAAVEAVQPTADAKGVRIKTVSGANAGPVLGDAQRLQQVLWNLLSNAIRFTPSGGCVQVDLERSGSHAELRVTDTGIGINAEFLPRVFERFAQGDSSITRSYGGLGMGLAIVKSLVELHGGIVAASSAGEGQGAVFTIRLPINTVWQGVKQRQTIQRAQLEEALTDNHELVGLKILIVDDEPDTCELLRFVFTECGAIVETAKNAEEALRLFDLWQPELLISDIAMPEIDGYELIRIIRKDRQSDIPAVALTALARIESRMRALSAGFQMHVPKPVEPGEVVRIVSGLVGLVDRGPK